MPKKFLLQLSRFLLRVLNFIFAALIFVLTAIAIFKPEWIQIFIGWMERQINSLGNWNYSIAFVSSIVESFPIIGVLVPGQNIMIFVGGFFAKLGQVQFIGTILIAIIGAMIGNSLGYFLGKWYGESFLGKYGDWFGLGKTELKYLKKQIAKNGAWFIIFGKFHGFTRAFVPFIAGSMGMHVKLFWIYNIIGSILWATTMIIFGVVFVTYYQVILSYLSYILFGILLMVIAYIARYKREEFKIYLKEKEMEILEKSKK